MAITRRTAMLGAAGLLIAAASPVGASPTTRTVGGPAFGTYWRLTLPTDANAAAASVAVTGVVDDVDRTMSPYRSSSDISLFNAARSTDWIALPSGMVSLVAASLAVADRTGGAFDPTVGPIVSLYGFGPIHQGAVTCSYRDLDVAESAVRKHQPDLTIDLCGIAKGQALDLIAAALRDLGMPTFLLELGGEVITGGAHPSGRPWQVGVERPLKSSTTIAHIVRPAGLALATSGVALQSYAIGARVYSHIIDPHLHAPADNIIASVSVLMPTGASADAFATAFVAMGPDDAIAFAERNAIPALFQLHTGTNIVERMTAGFANFIEA